MRMFASKSVRGKIVVETGLHIGGDTKSIEIGGMDNPIIRNPSTMEPYIPGSSIKGKMRSLFELTTGKYGPNGEPCNCGKADCPVCKVFGAANNTSEEEARRRGPTRLIVRDAFLTKEYGKRFFDGDVIIEEKNENAISRITAKANPRPLERVLPGVEFDFEFVYRMFDEGDEALFQTVVVKAMKLLERDYLGGGGSRGSGRIRFEDIVVTTCRDGMDDKVESLFLHDGEGK